MAPESPSYYYHVIVPNAAGDAVLATFTDDGYALPGWLADGGAFWQDTRSVNQRISAMFGLRVAMLRACRLDWSERARDSYYVVENLDPGWRPLDGWSWIGAAEVEQLPWHDDREQQALVEWVAEQPSRQRVAWYRPGWNEEARCWILAALESRRIHALGEIEQLRSWERSSVMRVETDAGLLYFKAVAPQWGHETALTGHLADRFPDVMPEVVAADPGTGRLLLREFDGIPLPDSRDLELWMSAYAALGRIQRKLTGSVDELLALGVPCRDPAVILQQIPDTLADRRRMRADMDAGLSDAQIETLQAAESLLIDACRRLASGLVPLSLDHGDFWPGNIYASRERITLFDWSDATITHPFFSLLMAADEIDGCLDGDPGASSQVIDAYLNEWLDYAPLDELRSIFDDAMLVAPLHQAIMYRTVYLPAMEFPDELDRMTPHFLRWLVGKVGSRKKLPLLSPPSKPTEGNLPETGELPAKLGSRPRSPSLEFEGGERGGSGC